MGVPAFFRWLTKKYPATVVNANEDRRRLDDGTRAPVDCTQPNPNFQEFDNLYLDMNGIIHPCTHPEDRPPPKNEDEMFALIFEYIDRIFSIVRPRRLLYMAIDGVAPRAKMNQQRSRRFRATEKTAHRRGHRGAAEKAEEAHFDSNCITPGTPFMARLADALRYYIHDRVTNDPAWANIEIILSDANVPGEGEHKIMDYVRKQRGNPAHDPNTVHCLCGADADLIMLGIATHEANFNIIREEFVPNQPRACDLCGQYGHELKECRGAENETDLGDDYCKPEQREKNFIFLRIPVLREYLEKELYMPNLPFEFNVERALDDWVFLCFFVGNDFLPHLPSLEIREGAIDRLIKLYKDMVYQMRGYLTKDGIPAMDRVEMIMSGLGKVEDEIFKRRQQQEERFRENEKAKKARFGNDRGRGRGRGRGRAQHPAYVPTQGILAPMSAPMHHSGESTRHMASDARQQAMRYTDDANAQAAANLKALLNVKGEESPAEANSRKRKADAPLIIPDNEQEEEEPADNIRLYESGWKDRYYRAKFDVGSDDVEFRHRVACAYVEGLCWVLRYYYQGCASWDWYFPYHYAPFASDFETVAEFSPDFSRKTKPFNPLEQLMSVFPAASKQHLPVEWQKLMISDESPIIDLYPADFRIDLNGKKFAWQGVALLPFVDEQRLLKTLESVYPTLTDEEKERNTRGPNRIFIGRNHKSFEFFQQIAQSGEGAEMVDLDPSLLNGVSGKIAADSTAVAPGQPFVSPVNHEECPDLATNCGICVLYEDPEYPDGYIFPAIGFNRNAPRGGLDQSGHRQVQYHVRGAQNDRMGGGDNWGTNSYRGGGGYHRSGGYEDRNGGGGGGYDRRPDFGRNYGGREGGGPQRYHDQRPGGGNNNYQHHQQAPRHHQQQDQYRGGGYPRGGGGPPGYSRPPYQGGRGRGGGYQGNASWR
ncbi:unnamed protein product [Caenorhabditis sp. 36 PRJEB53466]|nr:unnamed protein product [Caenorhabditis sp. 36 PRJEB53466]